MSETLGISFPNINSTIPARGNHYPDFYSNYFLAFSLELEPKYAFLNNKVSCVYILSSRHICYNSYILRFICIIMYTGFIYHFQYCLIFNICLFLLLLSCFQFFTNEKKVMLILIHRFSYICTQVSIEYIAKNGIVGLKNILNFNE